MKTIGEKLKDLLTKNGVKQIQFAENLGLSPSRISNYLTGKREPDIEVLSTMAKQLNVDLNYFSNQDFSKTTHGFSKKKVEEEGLVSLPYRSLSAKNRSTLNKSVYFDSHIIPNIEGTVVFDTGSVSCAGLFNENSYIVAAPFDKSILSGSVVFSTGRNYRFYYFVKGRKENVLMALDDKSSHSIEKGRNYYYIVRIIV